LDRGIGVWPSQPGPDGRASAAELFNVLRMKKPKAEPSVAGLLLLVSGMLLLSIVALTWLGSSGWGSENARWMLALVGLAIICVAAGAALSGLKKKLPR